MAGWPPKTPDRLVAEDWYAWHDRYDDPRTGLARRLALVRDRVRAALDEAPPGPLRVISLCAGQGTDLIGPLSRHPRRGDVTARLVELDPRNTAAARRLADEAGLDRVVRHRRHRHLDQGPLGAGPVPAGVRLVRGARFRAGLAL
jgi:hypothetical protein